MDKLNNFNFTNTRLSGHLVERAINFMYELDQFAQTFNEGRVGPGLLDSMLQRLLDGEANADLMFEALRAYMARTLVDDYSMTKEDGYELIMTIILTALHLAVQALQAESDDAAYDHLLDARYLRGLADGVIYSGNDALVRADLARLGAKARHVETEKMKEHIFVWYAQNHAMFRSVDAAAQAAIKQEPISFSTARKWINEYKRLKKL